MKCRSNARDEFSLARESLKSLETLKIYKNCLVNFVVLRVAAAVLERKNLFFNECVGCICKTQIYFTSALKIAPLGCKQFFEKNNLAEDG